MVKPTSRAARITSHNFRLAAASKPYSNRTVFKWFRFLMIYCGRFIQEYQCWISHECHCCTHFSFVSTTEINGQNYDVMEFMTYLNFSTRRFLYASKPKRLIILSQISGISDHFRPFNLHERIRMRKQKRLID